MTHQKLASRTAWLRKKAHPSTPVGRTESPSHEGETRALTGRFSFSTLALSGLAALSLVLASCGSGSGSQSARRVTSGSHSQNAAPTVSFLNPSRPIEVARGGKLTLEVLAADPDDVAMVTIYADQDGFLHTLQDQHILAGPFQEMNGIVHSIEVDTSGYATGRHILLAKIEDTSNPAVVVSAPGPLEVRNRSWATRAGGHWDDVVEGLAAFSDNSMLIVGPFRGNTVFGPEESQQTVLTSAGETDLYLARYAEDGFLEWAVQAGGPGFDQAIAVANLPDDSFQVVGFYEDQATFGAGTGNETVLNSQGGADLFLAHYDQDGQLLSVRNPGGPGYQEALDVSLREDGSLVVVGRFDGQVTFGLGTGLETTLASTGALDAFIASYDASGAFAWARQIGGMGEQIPWSAHTLADGSVLLAGSFEESAVFEAGKSSEVELHSEGEEDVFLAKYDASGQFLWAKAGGGPGMDSAMSLTSLADGSLVVVGLFHQDIRFGSDDPIQGEATSAGEDDMFVAGFNADGEFQWLNHYGSFERDVARDVTALEDGGFAFTGLFRLTISFDGGLTSFTANGSNDSFLTRCAADGTVLWAKRAGGDFKDGAFEVVPLSDGSLGVTGRFRNNARFGEDEEHDTTLRSLGDRDIYLARFNPDGSF